MDQELRQFLEAKFAEVDCQFNRNLERVESSLLTKFAEIDRKFATKEDLEKVETALLTEFHKWASPAEARAKTHTAALRAIDLELEQLSERVDKIEKRPPS